MVAKLKNPYTDRLNPSRTAGDDKKKQVAEAFEALNSFIRRHGGAVTSPPGKTLRIEVAKDSSAKLTDELTALGYAVMPRGSTMRVVGVVGPPDPWLERVTGVAPSPFCEVDVLEIRLDGK
jgi:hypothetical protein